MINFNKIENHISQPRNILSSLIDINIKNKKLKNYIKNNSKLTYFKSLVKDKNILELRKVLKTLKIKKIYNNEILFNYKDNPDNFYIIWKGKVDIWIPNTEIKSRKLNDLINEVGQDLYDKQKNNKNFINKKDNYCLFKKIKTLDEGCSFGGIGILNSKYRSSTVITNNNIFLNAIKENKKYKKWKKLDNYDNNDLDKVILAYITNKEFIDIIKDIEIIKINKKKFFLKKFFKEIIKDHLYPMITQYFDIIDLAKNKIIYEKNKKIKYVYIVKKGFINLEDTININLVDFNTLNEINDNIKNLKTIQAKNNYNNSFKNKQIKHKIRDIIKYDILGLDEFFNNKNNYYFTSTVSSYKAKLYKISINNLRILLNTFPEINNQLNTCALNFNNYFNIKLPKLIKFWKKNLGVINYKNINSKNNISIKPSSKNLYKIKNKLLNNSPYNCLYKSNKNKSMINKKSNITCSISKLKLFKDNSVKINKIIKPPLKTKKNSHLNFLYNSFKRWSIAKKSYMPKHIINKNSFNIKNKEDYSNKNINLKKYLYYNLNYNLNNFKSKKKQLIINNTKEIPINNFLRISNYN